ncbi:unnamed protein product [Vitrella brassicaformis CCMP3155]|uniref:Uncharacterized protein n=1 Tax=Vitrella brassicaformis (strain CCMP3155) TaxID=1169540 RepID=A0A0G4GHD5_VITBC|nr:unnamed protein product [Vitrella brassicaformis CCMP3155]|eukprot:CEM29145.1 unnamed protein product [Vitrella brassicaformis CCMP3155]
MRCPRPPVVLLYPCRHVCLCEECFNRMRLAAVPRFPRGEPSAEGQERCPACEMPIDLRRSSVVSGDAKTAAVRSRTPEPRPPSGNDHPKASLLNRSPPSDISDDEMSLYGATRGRIFRSRMRKSWRMGSVARSSSLTAPNAEALPREPPRPARPHIVYGPHGPPRPTPQRPNETHRLAEEITKEHPDAAVISRLMKEGAEPYAEANPNRPEVSVIEFAAEQPSGAARVMDVMLRRRSYVMTGADDVGHRRELVVACLKHALATALRRVDRELALSVMGHMRSLWCGWKETAADALMASLGCHSDIDIDTSRAFSGLVVELTTELDSWVGSVEQVRQGIVKTKGCVLAFRCMMDGGARKLLEVQEPLLDASTAKQRRLHEWWCAAMEVGSVDVLRELIREGYDVRVYFARPKGDSRFACDLDDSHRIAGLAEALHLGIDPSKGLHTLTHRRNNKDREGKHTVASMYGVYLRGLPDRIVGVINAALCDIALVYQSGLFRHPAVLEDSVLPLLRRFLFVPPAPHMRFATNTQFGRRMNACLDLFLRSVVGGFEGVAGGEVLGMGEALPRCRCFAIGSEGGRRVGLREIVEKARREESATHGLPTSSGASSMDDLSFLWREVGYLNGTTFVPLGLR